MKRLISVLLEARQSERAARGVVDDPPPRVDLYLFLFLKFMQSVIPTIEYDSTMEVKLE